MMQNLQIIINLIKLPSSNSHEKLLKRQFMILILVLNYNMNPIVKIKAVQFSFMSQKKISKNKRLCSFKKNNLIKLIKMIKKKIL